MFESIVAERSSARVYESAVSSPKKPAAMDMASGYEGSSATASASHLANCFKSPSCLCRSDASNANLEATRGSSNLLRPSDNNDSYSAIRCSTVLVFSITLRNRASCTVVSFGVTCNNPRIASSSKSERSAICATSIAARHIDGFLGSSLRDS